MFSRCLQTRLMLPEKKQRNRHERQPIAWPVTYIVPKVQLFHSRVSNVLHPFELTNCNILVMKWRDIEHTGLAYIFLFPLCEGCRHRDSCLDIHTKPRGHVCRQRSCMHSKLLPAFATRAAHSANTNTKQTKYLYFVAV